MVLKIDCVSQLKSHSPARAVLDFISTKKPFFSKFPVALDEEGDRFAFVNRKGVGLIAHTVVLAFQSANFLTDLAISPDRKAALLRFFDSSKDSFSKTLTRLDRLKFEYTRAKLVLSFVDESKTSDEFLTLARKLGITIMAPECFGECGFRFTNCRGEIVEFPDAKKTFSDLESEFSTVSSRLLLVEGILLSDSVFNL